MRLGVFHPVQFPRGLSIIVTNQKTGGGHVRRPPKARSIQPHGGLITRTVVLSIALSF